MNIGLAIKIELAKRRIRHYVLCDHMSMTNANLSLLLNDKREPKLSKVRQIAKFLDMPTSELVRRAEELEKARSQDS